MCVCIRRRRRSISLPSAKSEDNTDILLKRRSVHYHFYVYCIAKGMFTYSIFPPSNHNFFGNILTNNLFKLPTVQRTRSDLDKRVHSKVHEKINDVSIVFIRPSRRALMESS